MKKAIFLLTLCAYLPVCAQVVSFKVKCEDKGNPDLQLMVKAMENSSMSHRPMQQIENVYQGETEKASDGFYVLYGQTSKSQLQLPLYLPLPEPEYVLTLTMKGTCPQIYLDNNNKALSAFNEVIYTQSKHLWMEGKNIPKEQLLPFLKSYRNKADSIASLYSCANAVKEYLTLWASCQTYSDFKSMPMSTGVRKDELGFDLTDLTITAQQVCNHPMATYFYQTVNMALQALPKGTLMERMDYLHKEFTNEAVRKNVSEALVNNYLRRFNYVEKFEEGLQELTAVVDKYTLPQHYLQDFKARRSTVKGAVFPEDLRLVDASGNVVDFASLKGHIVYIDIWASWCVPCRKEIPHLQKLEAEMAGSNVKFLSISIDRKSDDWKKALTQLDLHGLQWHDEDGKLANALNINSIPFFLIYDKEGRLYHYNAPRPSSGEKLKALLKGLE